MANSSETQDETGEQRIIAGPLDNFCDAVLEALVDHRDKHKTSGKPLVVGVYGEWVSGKSLLLKRGHEELERNLEIGIGKAVDPGQLLFTPVWFNPWRYEREAHLIVPLLKTAQEAMSDWLAQSAPPTRKARPERQNPFRQTKPSTSSAQSDHDFAALNEIGRRLWRAAICTGNR